MVRISWLEPSSGSSSSLLEVSEGALHAEVESGKLQLEDVAERDDALVLVDLGRARRIVLREATECFANDLELPLGCRTEQRVGLVIDEGLPAAELLETLRGLEDVVQLLFGLKPHKGASSIARCSRGSRGS
jgi:hypothetical protein